MQARQHRLAQDEGAQIVDERGHRFVVDVDADQFLALFVLERGEGTPFVNDERLARGELPEGQRQPRDAIASTPLIQPYLDFTRIPSKAGPVVWRIVARERPRPGRWQMDALWIT